MLTRILHTVTLSLLFFGGSQAQIFTTYTVADGLASDNVHAVSIDGNGDVWFGTQAGISKFDGTNWTTINTTTDPDLVDNVVLALLVDDMGNIWAGTDFGVSKYDGNNWTTYTEADGLADDRIKFIAQGPDGRIWFGNSDGVSNFDGTTWESFTTSNGLPFGGVNHVAFDQNDEALLGTGLGGLYIHDGTGFTSITEDDQLLSNKIRSSLVDENNHRWIASAEGISVFDQNNNFLNDHEHIFTLPPPDSLNPIEDIQIDSRGYIWAGIFVDYLVTVGGVSLYAGNQWYQFDESDGLAGPVVRRLAINNMDDVWVTTSTGVSKISGFTVGIQNPNFKEEVWQIQPNPAADILVIETGDLETGETIRIYNSLGQLMLEEIMTNQQMEINIDALENGFYLVAVGNLLPKKLLVSK